VILTIDHSRGLVHEGERCLRVSRGPANQHRCSIILNVL